MVSAARAQGRPGAADRLARRRMPAPAELLTLAGALGAGVLFPFCAPMLGIPWALVGPRFFAVTLTSSVLVWVALSTSARRAASPQFDQLGDGLAAVAEVLRGGVHGRPWRPGELRALSLPALPGGDLARAFAAANALIEALETEHAFRCIVDASGDVVVILDDESRVTFTSAATYAVLGWTPAELAGKTLAGLVHADDLDRYLHLLDPARAGVPEEGPRPRLRLRAVDDTWHVLEWTVQLRRDRELGAVVLTGRDITGQAEMERELVHQANHDPLTGLPNRKALMRLAATAVAHASEQRQVAVLMIDLDRFKDVNDSLGHAVGDQLLAQVGPRLRSGLRPADTIARIGGDEFAVLLTRADAEAARMVADRLAAVLDDPFVVDGMDLHVEASIGIAVSHPDSPTGTPSGTPTGTPAEGSRPTSVEELLREADIAMYRAKEGGTGIATFDPGRDAGQSRSRLELAGELRRAIAEGQLVLHYQPVVDVLDGRLAGAEALVRWQHPERGLLAPGEFLPVAEQTGLIVPLSKVVLATALDQVASWLSAGREVQVAVNMSPRWLQHGDVPEIVAALLAQTGVPARLLRLEITESVLLAQPQEAMPMLEQLREMGIALSLDDFGTGYSSMTHLRQLPVDEVKVDRAFVHAMTTSPKDAVIVRAAVELGHNLGMTVVAEGIEDADTLAEVVAAGCTFAQGYYFSRPVPPEALIAWADERFPGWESTEDGGHRHDLAGTRSRC